MKYGNKVTHPKFLALMPKGRRLQDSGFTLVELIVVITILAILGTIAFISLQGYSATSRDSVRISDTGNMKTTLELFHLNAGKYPLPDNGGELTYSGITLFYQGTFGANVIQNVSRNMNEVPTDPLTELEYIYSVSNNKNELEILSLMETDDFALNGINQTNAAEISVTPKINGNYNGLFIKTATHIVPLPSIINTEVSLGSVIKLEDNNNIHSMVVNNGLNIPNYGNVATLTGKLDINLSVWTGNIAKDSTDTIKLDVYNAIATAYSGSSLENTGIIQALLSKTTDDEKIAMTETVVLKNTTTVASATITCDTGYSLVGSTCVLDCPTGFILVPGNTTFSTTDFCVAKYEMSFPGLTQTDATGDWNTYSYLDNAGTKPAVGAVVSAQGNSPIAEITQPEAIAECTAMGAGYHLITNNEWMTIARNIEAQNINWSNGTVGSGYISNGISNDTTLGCLGNGASNLPTPSIYATVTGADICGGKNKHTLSNGQEVWDLSGNVWEHVNKANTIDGTGFDTGINPDLLATNNAWGEWSGATQGNRDLYGPSVAIDATDGIGRIYQADGTIFFRGAQASSASHAGVFTLGLYWASTDRHRGVGFRCTK